MDEPVANPWTTLSIELKYENPWIRVHEHKVLTPRGEPGIYGVVSFRSVAVGILPVDEKGFTYLVGQYRYPLDAYSWEIPEGGGDPNTTTLSSAKRELLEETGLEADRWDEILNITTSNSVTNERATCFLATGLRQGKADPDPTEELTVRRLPLDEAIGMVLDGRIHDAISVAVLLRAKLMMIAGDPRLPRSLR